MNHFTNQRVPTVNGITVMKVWRLEQMFALTCKLISIKLSPESCNTNTNEVLVLPSACPPEPEWRTNVGAASHSSRWFQLKLLISCNWVAFFSKKKTQTKKTPLFARTAACVTAKWKIKLWYINSPVVCVNMIDATVWCTFVFIISTWQVHKYNRS